MGHLHAHIEEAIVLIVAVALFVLGVVVKSFRKAIGLLLVLVGALATLTSIRFVIGVPLILLGGVLLLI